MFSHGDFSVRLKSIRKSHNLTQQDIASILNLTRTQISDMENGKTTTSLERLWKLADFFNVSIDYLVGRSDNPKRR
jgi:transcriptional regulator with XRE-family HTH domain